MGQRCVGSGRAIWARAGRRTSLAVIVALGLAGLMNLPGSPFGQTPTGQAWAQTLPREYDATRVQTVVNELERRIRNLEGRGWQIVQSESEPGGSGPLVWVKNSTQRAFVRLAGRWFELYASTQSGSGSGGTPVWPISPEWIGEGTISWDELAELNSDSLGGILLRQFIQNKADTNWVQGQISDSLAAFGGLQPSDTLTFLSTKTNDAAVVAPKIDSTRALTLIGARADSGTALYWPDSTAFLAYVKTLIGARADSATALYWPDSTAFLTYVKALILARADSALALYWPDTTAILTYVKALVGARADSALALYWPDTTAILTYVKALANSKADSGGAGMLAQAETIAGNWNNTANPWGVPEGGIGTNTLTSHGLLLGAATSAVVALAEASNGQIPIGSTGANPTLATITGTASNITVTNGAGTITLLNSPTCHYYREYLIYADGGLATYSVVGEPALTLTATQATNDQATAPYISNTTAATANFSSGLITTTAALMQRRWQPTFTAWILTGAAVTAQQITVGFTSANIDSTGKPNFHQACFWFSTNWSHTTWWTKTIAGTGSSGSYQNTNINCTAATFYKLTIVCSNTTPDVKFYINNALVTTHTGVSLPTSTQGMGWTAKITATTASAKVFSLSQIAITYVN